MVFMSIIFAGAMGPGVAFSALSILVYQGILTLISVWVKPFVTDIMLAELTGIGGALVIMIGLGPPRYQEVQNRRFPPRPHHHHPACTCISICIVSYN